MDKETWIMVNLFVEHQGDEIDRSVLADRLQDVGRFEEEQFLRGTKEAAEAFFGLIVPSPHLPHDPIYLRCPITARLMNRAWANAHRSIARSRSLIERYQSSKAFVRSFLTISDLISHPEWAMPSFSDDWKRFSVRVISARIFAEFQSILDGIAETTDLFNACVY